jgi:hypothetical protein
MEQTLTTKLQEFALSAAGRVEECLRKAEEMDEHAAALEASSPTTPNIAAGKRREAQQHRAESSRWAARSAAAAEGFLLLDGLEQDPKFTLARENQALMAQAAKEHRIRWAGAPPRE